MKQIMRKLNFCLVDSLVKVPPDHFCFPDLKLFFNHFFIIISYLTINYSIQSKYNPD